MKTFENTVFIDNYYNLLHSLNREDKIKIMAKLSLSIAEYKEEKQMPKVDVSFGGWADMNKTAEQICSEIRADRTFRNREIVL